jgi:hypothetical protein
MDSLDSLHVRKKKNDFENSIDSLEIFETPTKQFATDDYIDPDGSTMSSSLGDTSFITIADLGKFRDIERKIDVINKLVELEERKLHQERIRRENRVKPLFDGNTKERGFVKNLTRNFDKLAKSGYEDINSPLMSGCGMKRNYSLPDVLEGAKFQTFEFDDIDEPATKNADYYDQTCSRSMKLYDFDDDFQMITDGSGEGVHKLLERAEIYTNNFKFVYARCMMNMAG